jgi:hypothetical protein
VPAPLARGTSFKKKPSSLSVTGQNNVDTPRLLPLNTTGKDRLSSTVALDHSMKYSLALKKSLTASLILV